MARLSSSALVAATLLLSPALAVGADVTCYVDGVEGVDGRAGTSEAQAVRSQSAVPSSCTIIRYKRGSVFHEKLALRRGVKTYGNYGAPSDPLPRFVVPRTANSGPVVQAVGYSGITIDGLSLAGATGDGTMQGIIGGLGVMLGSNSKLLNSEITDCDIGIMVAGTGSLVRGNYVHDLVMGIDGEPGVDPNDVGGAEGIFVNDSNNEVAYNRFVRCKGPARWVGANGDCDGGATEVSVGSGKTVSGVKIHHNFSLDSCGFFEVATVRGDKGTFADSDLYENVIVDSGWMGLLQVNNTSLSNVRFFNNTLVQRAGSTNAGLLWIIYTGTSSGVSGGALAPGAVSLIDNLYVFDGVTPLGTVIDPAFAQTNNLVLQTSQQDPRFVNLDGSTAADFDLAAGSPAIDAGTAVAGNTRDFLDRPIPAGAKPDVGAFERQVGAGSSSSSGSSSGSSSSSGGIPPAGTGGGASGGGCASGPVEPASLALLLGALALRRRRVTQGGRRARAA